MKTVFVSLCSDYFYISVPHIEFLNPRGIKCIIDNCENIPLNPQEQHRNEDYVNFKMNVPNRLVFRAVVAKLGLFLYCCVEEGLTIVPV